MRSVLDMPPVADLAREEQREAVVVEEPRVVRVHARAELPVHDRLRDLAARHPVGHEPADAVVTSTVLQHIPPEEIAAAADAIKTLTRRIVVIRETTYLKHAASYQFAHDYEKLFEPWRAIHRVVTDEHEHVRVELIAFIPAAK